MKKAFLFILLIIVAIICGFLWQEGFFSPVQITEKDTGSFYMVYKDHVGDYKQTGMVMDDVYQELFIDGIKAVRGVGIYYDNPKEVPKEDLRSQVGVIVERDDYNELSALEDKYLIKYVSGANSVVSEFPYKNKISIILGVYKIYPPLLKYIEEKGYERGPIMEIYDKLDKRIYYIMNIE